MKGQTGEITTFILHIILPIAIVLIIIGLVILYLQGQGFNVSPADLPSVAP